MPELATEADAAVGESALRKAAWRLIPLIAIGYGIAFIDRQNLSFANLHMTQDLRFSATAYGFGAGVFFLSYAACEIPSNLLLYRFGARRWLARIMFTWGLVSVAMMFVRNEQQFYLARFFLGVAEAGFFPGIVYYLMQWFPPHLRARTISRFYVSYPLSTVVMGVVSPWLLGLDGQWGLKGWQWLFLVEGIPAVLFSFVLLRYLPDTPKDAKWLTEPERDYIVKQIDDDAKTGGHTHNILAALSDPRVMMLGAFAFFMQFVMYAYQFSAPAMIKAFTHQTDQTVGYITAGMGLVGAVGMLTNAVLSDRKGERYLHIVGSFALILIGFIVGGLIGASLHVNFVLGGLTGDAVVALAAFTLVVIGNAALQPPYLSLPAVFLKGKSAAAGIAAINMIGILGGFFGPFWMGIVKDHKGTDQFAVLTLALPSVVAIVIVLLMRRSHLASSSRVETTQPLVAD